MNDAALLELLTATGQLEASQKRWTAKLPPVQREDMEAMCRPKWTERHENEFMKKMESLDLSKRREEVMKAWASREQHHEQMWKVCCHFLRTTPDMIIGSGNLLVYHGDHCTNENWSRAFCESFTLLAAHHYWGGIWTRLRLAIQFAVICRTNDKRRWVPCPAGDSITFDLNSELFIKRKKGQTIPERLEYFISKSPELGSDKGSLEVLCSRINTICTKRGIQSESIETEEQFSNNSTTSATPLDPYFVRTEDLEVIIEALDDIANDCMSMALVPSVRLFSQMILPTMGPGPSMPRTPEDFMEFKDKSFLANMRATHLLTQELTRQASRNAPRPAPSFDNIPGLKREGSPDIFMDPKRPRVESRQEADETMQRIGGIGQSPDEAIDHGRPASSVQVEDPRRFDDLLYSDAEVCTFEGGVSRDQAPQAFDFQAVDRSNCLPGFTQRTTGVKVQTLRRAFRDPGFMGPGR